MSDTLVLSTVNASLPRPIDGATLAACLTDAAARPGWYGHLAIFFTEVSVDAIEAFAAEHRVPLPAVAAAYAATREHTGDLGVHESLIHRWSKALAADGDQAFPGNGRLKADDEEIRKLPLLVGAHHPASRACQ